MKHRAVYFIVILFAGIFASGVGNAESNQSKIAIVDIERVIGESDVSKSIHKQLEKQREEYQKNIDKKDADLKSQKEAIEKDRASLSPEAFEKKEREFYTNIAEAQRSVQVQRAELGKAYDEAISKVYRKTREIISNLATEKGFIVALPSSQILYNDAALDISEDVFKRLNKEMQHQQVNFDHSNVKADAAASANAKASPAKKDKASKEKKKS